MFHRLGAGLPWRHLRSRNGERRWTLRGCNPNGLRPGGSKPSAKPGEPQPQLRPPGAGPSSCPLSRASPTPSTTQGNGSGATCRGMGPCCPVDWGFPGRLPLQEVLPLAVMVAGNRWADVSWARRELGFKPWTRLAKGLVPTVEHLSASVGAPRGSRRYWSSRPHRAPKPLDCRDLHHHKNGGRPKGEQIFIPIQQLPLSREEGVSPCPRPGALVVDIRSIVIPGPGYHPGEGREFFPWQLSSF